MSMKEALKSETIEARGFSSVFLFIQFCWGFKYFKIKNTSGHWMLCVLPHTFFFKLHILKEATYWEARLLLAHFFAVQTSDLWVSIRFKKTPYIFVMLLSVFHPPLPLPAIKPEQYSLIWQLFTAWSVHLNGWGLPHPIRSISMMNFSSRFNFAYAANKINNIISKRTSASQQLWAVKQLKY